MSKFGKKLRSLRKAKNLTQRQLATKAGVSHNYVSNLEKDKHPNPSVWICLDLARALDIDLSDLTS